MAAKKKTRIYDKRVDGCPYAPVDLESIWHEAFLAGVEKALEMLAKGELITESDVMTAREKLMKEGMYRD